MTSNAASLARRVGFLLLLILIIFVATWAAIRLKKPPIVPAKPAAVSQPTKAFDKAEWGMSPHEVEKVNGNALLKTESSRAFYAVNERIKDKARYQMYAVENFTFLGRKAELTYVFFDDKLFTYHLFARDEEADELDRDMRQYLTKTFGSKYSETNDSGSAKLIWMQKELVVNYWFFRDDFRLIPAYKAGFGVEYRPAAEAINRLS